MRLFSLQRASDLLVAAVSLSLFGPWFALAGAYAGDHQIPGLFWRFSLLAMAAFVSAETTRGWRADLSASQRRWAMLGVGFLGTILAFLLMVLPMGLFSDVRWPLWLLLGAWGWIQGLRLSASPRDNLGMHWQLVSGTVTLSVAILAASWGGLWDELGGVIVAFAMFWLVGSVLATALTRFAEMSERYGGEAAARFWPPLLIGLVTVSLALTFILAAGTPVALAVLSGPTQLVRRLLEMGLLVVGYGLGYIVAVVIWILRRIITPDEPAEFEPPDTGEIAPLEPREPAAWLAPAAEVARWAGAGAVALVVVLAAVYYMMKIWRREEKVDPDEVRESFASAGALSGWARRRWKDLLMSASTGVRNMANVYLRRPATALEVYHTVLRQARKLGTVKPREITAKQFQPALRNCFSHAESSVDRVFLGFSREFYGGIDTSTSELRDLRSELAKIRSDADQETPASQQTSEDGDCRP